MTRLNGWQRIWVVLALLWALLAGFISWEQIPSPPSHYREWQNAEVVERIGGWDQEGCPTDWEAENWARERLKLRLARTPAEKPPSTAVLATGNDTKIRVRFLQLSDSSWVTLCAGESVSWDEFSRVASEYRAAYDRITHEQRNDYYLRSVLLVVFPPALLYGVGLTIRWIVRGFKTPS